MTWYVVYRVGSKPEVVSGISLKKLLSYARRHGKFIASFCIS